MDFVKFTRYCRLSCVIWSILFTINTPTYKLAKSLVPILKSLTSNKYAVNESFDLAEEITEQDSDFLWEE